MNLKASAIAPACMVSPWAALAGNASGANVDFSWNGALWGLFGAPVGDPSRNNLVFSPAGFVAEALNSAGVVLTHDTTKVTVTAKPGFC